MQRTKENLLEIWNLYNIIKRYYSKNIIFKREELIIREKKSELNTFRQDIKQRNT